MGAGIVGMVLVRAVGLPPKPPLLQPLGDRSASGAGSGAPQRAVAATPPSPALQASAWPGLAVLPVARPAPAGSGDPRRWSAAIRLRPPALVLEPGVFTWSDPRRIAASLLRSAEHSALRRRSAYGSAMAMLCLYINRAGRRLDAQRLATLQAAKLELRALANAGNRPGIGSVSDALPHD